MEENWIADSTRVTDGPGIDLLILYSTRLMILCHFDYKHCFHSRSLANYFYQYLRLPSVSSSVITDVHKMIDPSDTFSVFLKTIAGQFTAVSQLLLLLFFYFCCDGKMIFLSGKTRQCLSIISGVQLEAREKPHLRVHSCQTQSGEIVRKNIPPQHRERNVFWFSI